MKITLILSALILSINALASGELYEAECKPASSKGKITGYLCEKIGQSSNFGKAGLKDGDLVKTVDGVPVVDQVTASSFFSQVRRGEVKEIVIVRNGAEETLHPKFQ